MNPLLIKETIRPIDKFLFRDIENLKDAIKNIYWDDIQNWEIPYQSNWNAPVKMLKLDPKKDCSKENPLYLFRPWMERILTDERFNLSDGQIGGICGVSGTHNQRVRNNLLNIPKPSFRFKRVKSNKYILIDLPDNYDNPFSIIQSSGKKQLLEHRYILEKYLADLLSKTSQFSERELRDLEIARNCLIREKYLNPSCEVHHINLDGFDNRIENLWVIQPKNEHMSIHSTLLQLVNELLNLGLIIFKEGEYFLDFRY